MIYRYVFDEIEEWLASRRPKCLVLRGARQVGKTTAIRSLPSVRGGETGLCELNLERHPDLEKVFAGGDTGRMLEEIGFTAGRSPNDGDIVFLDEVQAAPSALPALRYLAEDCPGMRWVAAGSLLDAELRESDTPVPVGRMQYLFMGPLSLEEYMEGAGDLGMELQLIREWAPGQSFPSAAHRHLCAALRRFLVVGGMPEVTESWLETGSAGEVARLQASIMNTYRDDFAKYASRTDLSLLRRIFDWVPARAGDKVIYSHISPDSRAGKVRRAIEYLTDARVVSPAVHSHGNGLPLGSEARPRVYKLYFLDVGLTAAATRVQKIDPQMLHSREFINSGRLAEQFVAQHLLFRGPSWERPALYYWLREGRSGNAEVDFLLEGPRGVVPLEVKAGASGSMKSLLRFVMEKGSPAAVRLDMNPPSLQRVQHRIGTGTGSREISFDLLSLPLYMVGQIGRLLGQT
ncbi:MAG: DUF4143 domain-containing protein [Candidatus Aegiribacteria sp.]